MFTSVCRNKVSSFPAHSHTLRFHTHTHTRARACTDKHTEQPFVCTLAEHTIIQKWTSPSKQKTCREAAHAHTRWHAVRHAQPPYVITLKCLEPQHSWRCTEEACVCVCVCVCVFVCVWMPGVQQSSCHYVCCIYNCVLLCTCCVTCRLGASSCIWSWIKMFCTSSVHLSLSVCLSQCVFW